MAADAGLLTGGPGLSLCPLLATRSSAELSKPGRPLEKCEETEVKLCCQNNWIQTLCIHHICTDRREKCKNEVVKNKHLLSKNTLFFLMTPGTWVCVDWLKCQVWLLSRIPQHHYYKKTKNKTAIKKDGESTIKNIICCSPKHKWLIFNEFKKCHCKW